MRRFMRTSPELILARDLLVLKRRKKCATSALKATGGAAERIHLSGSDHYGSTANVL